MYQLIHQWLLIGLLVLAFAPCAQGEGELIIMDRNGIRKLDSDLKPVTPKPKDANKAAKRRTAYISAHPELPQALREAIVAGKPAVGMTNEHVMACCGSPVDRRSSESSEGHLERWQYGFPGGRIPFGHFLTADLNDFHDHCLLNFVEGVLVSWECPD
jgi:hypothetical protein